MKCIRFTTRGVRVLQRSHERRLFIPQSNVCDVCVCTPTVQCAVKMGGIFTLTARMNHSCDPNAEVRGQEYVDCNIDILAKRNICSGEESCISYVNLGSQPTSSSIIAGNRRRRELRARYLFDCQCSRCTRSV